MAKIIAVSNQKGGVGKTTSAVNLASCVADRGFRVLLVDLDPQGNATSGCGIRKKNLLRSSYELIIGENISPPDTIVATPFRNLSVIPSTMNLAGAELELADMPRRAQRLKESLAMINKSDFDFIFIDCPPSLGLLTINALTAADTVLIPIQCEFYALEGLSQLTNTIRQVKRNYNPSLEIEGVLITMFDSRLNLTMQVLADVKRFFAEKTYKTVIPRNVRISEAPSHGKPINHYDKNAKGTAAYYSLADEFLKNNGKAVRK